MRKKQFTEVFKQAISQHAAYIGVGVQTEGSRRPEIIINPNENFKEKLEYYRAAYDEDMALVSAKGKKDIRIVSVCWGDSFADIEFQMQVDPPDWKKTISDAVDRVVRRMFDESPEISQEEREVWEVVLEGYKEQFFSRRYSISQQRFITENGALYEDMFETCMNGSNEEFKKKFLHLSKELNNHA